MRDVFNQSAHQLSAYVSCGSIDVLTLNCKLQQSHKMQSIIYKLRRGTQQRSNFLMCHSTPLVPTTHHLGQPRSGTYQTQSKSSQVKWRRKCAHCNCIYTLSSCDVRAREGEEQKKRGRERESGTAVYRNWHPDCISIFIRSNFNVQRRHL